ncbi:endonuclease/exonuclease/phosphatase family protein [Oceanomicrobium pacificus]|uniref:Endonuclease/exonuclease/phosphatase domain-containing protein n=1 Tax=Oceanomicrobium pacificus TaxID=2692916 RepID=A0A6B0TZX3_9RHOB|nr:endonuclease/exonuclease/phosphatase family protein [Oceanomicrobium pacificus]MXU66534.1 hypothetical protein [Oceanomicrobium pacificus]
MLRIASYNIRKSVGLDGRRDPMRILSVLQEIDADIVILQEADLRFGDRISSLPQDVIEADSAYTIAGIARRTGSIGWHGNAILVRDALPILRRHKFMLPTLEPRGAIMVDVDVDGQRLRVVGVHLALLSTVRRQQVRRVLAKLDRLSGSPPTVVAGDFNEWRRSGPNLRDFTRQFQLVTPGPSFHAARPVVALDRFATGHGVRVEACGVHHSDLSRQASDHLPIWADITLDETDSGTAD